VLSGNVAGSLNVDTLIKEFFLLAGAGSRLIPHIPLKTNP
jgi:hypothetical protein